MVHRQFRNFSMALTVNRRTIFRRVLRLSQQCGDSFVFERLLLVRIVTESQLNILGKLREWNSHDAALKLDYYPVSFDSADSGIFILLALSRLEVIA